MRHSISAIMGLAILACFSDFGMAQQKSKDTKTKTETKTSTTTKTKSSKNQEIVIKKTGDDSKKMTIIISGDDITVNGKPIDEYKGGDLIISKRNYEDWGGWGEVPQVHVTMPRSPRVMVAPRVMTVPRYNFSWSDEDEKSRPMLGVYTENDDKGAKITDVVDESPAEKAGLKKGDIITKVGDKKIEDPSSLAETVGNNKPNTEIEITYLRDGKEQKMKVKLGERKSSGYKSFNYSFPNEEYNFSGPGEGNNNFNFYYNKKPRLGARIQDTEDGNGVKVLDVQEGSVADKAGLKKDDVITEIDGKQVKSADDAREVMSDLGDKNAYTIKANRNGASVSIDVKIPKPLKTSNL